MQAPDSLYHAIVQTTGHSLVRLGELWLPKTTVLVFIRHFGCMSCHEQVAELRPYFGRIRDAGAQVAIIGNGGRRAALNFIDMHQLDVPVFLDPGLKAYRAAGLKRGLLATVGPGAIRNVRRALANGHRQTGLHGDLLQQGGVLIINPSSEVLYQYISQETGDHPAPESILAALQA
jgi:peroxiredoxin